MPTLSQRLLVTRRSALAAAQTVVKLAQLEGDRVAGRWAQDGPRITHWANRWARQLLDTYGVEIHAAGPYIGEGMPYAARELSGRGRLFVMNHRSSMDILVGVALTEGRMLSRHDIAAWPLIGQAAQATGTLFVDRSSPSSGAAVLKEMTRSLEEGRAVSLFPEGTSFDGDEVRPLHPGAFRAAMKAKAKIIPIGLAYDHTAAYFGDESFGAHFERMTALPVLRIGATAGRPVDAAAFQSLRDLRTEVRRALQLAVNASRARIGPPRTR